MVLLLPPSVLPKFSAVLVDFWCPPAWLRSLCHDCWLVLYRKTDVFLSGRVPVSWCKYGISVYHPLSSGSLAGVHLPSGACLAYVGSGEWPDGISKSSISVAPGRPCAVSENKS